MENTIYLRICGRWHLGQGFVYAHRVLCQSDQEPIDGEFDSCHETDRDRKG
jgi:hypothetical protein